MLETAWGFKSPLAHQAKNRKAPEESGAFPVPGVPSAWSGVCARPSVAHRARIRPGGAARPRHAGAAEPVDTFCTVGPRSLDGRQTVPRTVRDMTDSTTPDGSSDPTETQQQYTEDLPDGSSTGDATEDPQQDSDVDSGGEPADPQ